MIIQAIKFQMIYSPIFGSQIHKFNYISPLNFHNYYTNASKGGNNKGRIINNHISHQSGYTVNYSGIQDYSRKSTKMIQKKTHEPLSQEKEPIPRNQAKKYNEIEEINKMLEF